MRIGKNSKRLGRRGQIDDLKIVAVDMERPNRFHGPEDKDMSTIDTDNNANLPNVAGTWAGAMDFRIVKGNLTLVLNQDGAGQLTGTASSTPPGCKFSLSVTGAVYHDGKWFV
jgi:hypothetical protein